MATAMTDFVLVSQEMMAVPAHKILIAIAATAMAVFVRHVKKQQCYVPAMVIVAVVNVSIVFVHAYQTMVVAVIITVNVQAVIVI